MVTSELVSAARCCGRQRHPQRSVHRVVTVHRGRQQVHRGRADEPGDEEVDRLREQLAGRRHLLQQALVEHGHPVTHRHRLDLVVGDVDGRHPEPVLQRRDLGAGLDPQLGVEVGQRLVHQEHRRLAHDRPAHRHPLALTARQLGRLAIEQLFEVEDLGGVTHPLRPLGLGHPLHLQVEADVLADGHVRVERVRLEHHGDVPILGGHVGDVAVADVDRAVVDRFQPGQHPQRGRLAAPGRPDQHEELAVVDQQVEVVDGGPSRAPGRCGWHR